MIHQWTHFTRYHLILYVADSTLNNTRVINSTHIRVPKVLERVDLKLNSVEDSIAKNLSIDPCNIIHSLVHKLAPPIYSRMDGCGIFIHKFSRKTLQLC